MDEQTQDQSEQPSARVQYEDVAKLLAHSSREIEICLRSLADYAHDDTRAHWLRLLRAAIGSAYVTINVVEIPED